jgi:23S rRNA-/tRNA-specific pseudouridylate synthase
MIRNHSTRARIVIAVDSEFGEHQSTGLLRGYLRRHHPHPRRAPHALHAARVTFPHPTGAAITAEAPLPDDLARLIG